MTVNITAFQPGVALTGTMAAVATPAVGGQVTSGWAVNAGSSAGTLTLSVSRGGAMALPLIVSRVVAATSTLQLPEFNSFPLSSGDTLTASGSGLVLYLNGFTVTA